MSPGYEITTDADRIDAVIVHRWLAKESYWARDRSAEAVKRSMANSICLGAFDGEQLVGFARVVTDRATFAWLCDVFVEEFHRGQGVGGALIATAVGHPELSGIKRFVLATADAQEVYRAHGFEVIDHPERWMIRRGTGA